MKMLVTGAAGFIGAAVTDELLSRGHRVVALVRCSVAQRWTERDNLEVMRLDLRQGGSLDLKGQGIDIVLHLAAATQGCAQRQLEDTVTGTANLLAAARAAGIHRLVGISSMAILDCRRCSPLSIIDEHTPVADDAAVSAYAAAKIRQERLFLEFAQQPGNSCSILRPGLVYDRTRLTAGHAGMVRTRIAILASHGGEVPTVEVRSLAAAIGNTAEKSLQGAEVIHVLDDDLPSQSSYIAGLRRRGLLPRVTLIVNWRVLQAAFWAAATVLAWTGLAERAPDLLQPTSFAVRLKPLRFSNSKAKRLLAWAPARGFA